MAQEASSRPIEDPVAAFARHVAADPDAIAIEADDAGAPTWTRAELSERADRVAAALAEAGVQAGDLVGLHLSRSGGLIAAVLGALRIGAAYAPLDPLQPAARLRAISEEAGLAALFTERRLEEASTAALADRRLVLEDVFAGPPRQAPPACVDAERLAYVIFTSGSTGRPKGVALSRRAVARYAAWAQETFAQDAPSTWALHSAIGFDLTVTSIFAPLISGGAIKPYQEREETPDLAILRVFEQDAVDIVKLTPAHLSLGPRPRRRRDAADPDAHTGRRGVGNALAAQAQTALGPGTALFNEYGPTEAAVGCMVHRFDPVRDVEAAVPIGRPAAATAIYVLDSSGAPAPDEVVGELFVAGPSRLAEGYWRDDAETAASFVSDPLSAGRAHVSDRRSRLPALGRRNALSWAGGRAAEAARRAHRAGGDPASGALPSWRRRLRGGRRPDRRRAPSRSAAPMRALRHWRRPSRSTYWRGRGL